MSTQSVVPKAIILTSRFPMFRAVSATKRQKKLMLHSLYGTSSKPVSTNLPTKAGVLGNIKTSSESFLPLIYKSIALASSLLSSITTHITNANIVFSSKSQTHSQKNSANPDVKTVLEESKESTILKDELKVKNDLESTLQPDRVQEGNSEQMFLELLSGSDKQTKELEFYNQEEKKPEKSKKALISKSSLQQRSRFLVSSLADAFSSGSQLLRLEEVCKHLLLYPEQKAIMCKAGLLRIALQLKHDFSDPAIQAQARCVLALIGYHEPPKGEGIRILCIDGGGTKGVMAIEILRQLEIATNKKVCELFDYMCGVSSGAILCMLLGGLQKTPDECEELYRKLSNEIFNSSTFWGTGRLMWSHAYYDTTAWLNVLKKTFGESLIIDTAKDKTAPKIGAVSAIMNLPHLEAFVFRNYDFSPSMQSYYRGSCRYRMWESIRASGAAPGYFEEFRLDDLLHQDGGILLNNPTALAIHESRLLWPSEPIQCVVSLGCGRYIPATNPDFTSTSLKTKIMKVIDSATDTESVHVAVNDLLTPDTYFRLNPYLTEYFTLDENRTEKLDQMKTDVQMYLRRNEYKFSSAARTLLFSRNHLKRVKDWCQVQKDMVL